MVSATVPLGQPPPQMHQRRSGVRDGQGVGKEGFCLLDAPHWGRKRRGWLDPRSEVVGRDR